MSKVVDVSNQITAQTVQYAPMAMAGVLAAEQSSASGEDKKQAVLDSILGAAKVGEGIPNPEVAAVSGLVDMFVSIFNALGLFKKKPATTLSQTVPTPPSRPLPTANPT